MHTSGVIVSIFLCKFDQKPSTFQTLLASCHRTLRYEFELTGKAFNAEISGEGRSSTNFYLFTYVFFDTIILCRENMYLYIYIYTHTTYTHRIR